MENNKIKLIQPIDLPEDEVNQFKNFDSLLEQRQGFWELVVESKIPFSLGVLIVLLTSMHFSFRLENDKWGNLTRISDKKQNLLLSELRVNEDFKNIPELEVEINEAPTFEPKSEKEEVIKEKPVELKENLESEESQEPELSTFQNAAPLNGFDDLYQYFALNLRYPEEAIGDSIEGIVKLKFTVRSDSTISDITVIETPTSYFNEESIRLIENMPKWKPASHNNIPIDKEFIIPLRFNIQ